VSAAQADEDEHRAEGQQREHERGALTDADPEQADPDEEGEEERPDERQDPGIDAGRSQMHGAATIKRRRRVSALGPKKFAEPVSLSSTASADLPLPGTALGLGFDLLALRARRKQHTNVSRKPVKGSKKDVSAICGNFSFHHFHSLSSSLWKGLWKGSAP